MKKNQFGHEKKMEQVIKRGKTDAMNEITEITKDLIALEERKVRYDKQLQFQLKTEAEVDEETERALERLREIEEVAKAEGLLDKEPEDEYSMLYSPERVRDMKKKIEKHSINAIHRKFFTIITRQKEKLSTVLRNYNDSLSIHYEQINPHGSNLNNTLEFKKEEIKNENSKNSQSPNKIKIKQHFLIQEINKSLAQLKKSLPAISSKLPWKRSSWNNKSQLGSFDTRLKRASVNR